MPPAWPDPLHSHRVLCLKGALRDFSSHPGQRNLLLYPTVLSVHSRQLKKSTMGHSHTDQKLKHEENLVE